MTNPRHAVDPSRSLFKAKDAIQAQDWIDKGADVFFANAKGHTALSSAVRKGRVDVARVLLAAGARVDVVDCLGIPLCLNAARSGSVAMLDLMRESGMDLSLRDKSGATALMVSSSPSMIHRLVDLGHDVHAIDSQGFAAVHHLARESRFLLAPGFSALLERGADINALSHDGRTPAMVCQHPVALADLLAMGADASPVDASGRNVLHSMARMGFKLDKKIVQQALKSGADPFHADQAGHTPMSLFSDPGGIGNRLLDGAGSFEEWVAQEQSERMARNTPKASSPLVKPRF